MAQGFGAFIVYVKRDSSMPGGYTGYSAHFGPFDSWQELNREIENYEQRINSNLDSQERWIPIHIRKAEKTKQDGEWETRSFLSCGRVNPEIYTDNILDD